MMVLLVVLLLVLLLLILLLLLLVRLPATVCAATVDAAPAVGGEDPTDVMMLRLAVTADTVNFGGLELWSSKRRGSF